MRKRTFAQSLGTALATWTLRWGTDLILKSVRRLFQLGFVLLMMATFLAPIAECFDRWDPPGLNNDKEFPLFLFVLFVCLVLVVAKLVSLRALTLQFVSRLVPLPVAFAFECIASVMPAPVPPHSSPPLRI